MFRLIGGLLFAASLLLVGCREPIAVAAMPEEKAELVMVYVFNESSYNVAFYVDGDYKTEIDPHGWATFGVSVGYHTFFADKEADGIDITERVYVPSGGMNYTIP